MSVSPIWLHIYSTQELSQKMIMVATLFVSFDQNNLGKKKGPFGPLLFDAFAPSVHPDKAPVWTLDDALKPRIFCVSNCALAC